MLHSRRGNRCFRLHHRRQLIYTHTQLGQLFIVHLDIDLLRLYTQQFHFLNIRYLYKLVFDKAGYLTHLLVRETVGGDGVHVAEHIVKVIIKERSVHIGGQLASFVIDKITHVQPVAGDRFRRNALFQINVDYADARPGIAGNIIHVVYGLYHFFNLVCHMHFHLLGSSSRPGSGNNHLRKGEAGIFLTAQHRIAEDSHDCNQGREEVDDLFMFDCPFGPVTVHFASLPSRRTSCPSANLLIPPVTTTSPLDRPSVIFTSLPSKPAVFTGTRDTFLSLTTQTCA